MLLGILKRAMQCWLLCVYYCQLSFAGVKNLRIPGKKMLRNQKLPFLNKS